MTKDDRLYARITLDFADSPKIAPLSDGAFRALLEMTLYSRRMLTDGFIPEGIAKKNWRPKVITELMGNDPERPSLERAVGGYFIRDFAEHQDTKAEVEARRDRNRANGRVGGLANSKRLAKQVAKQVASESVEVGSAEPRSETVAETETETTNSKELVRGKRGSRIPDDFTITDAMREWAKTNVPLVDLDAVLGEFVDYWKSVPGQRGLSLNWTLTWYNGMRKQQTFAVRDGKTISGDTWAGIPRVGDTA